MAGKPGFLSELKRRRVIRTAAMYAVVAFVVAQVADLLLPALLLPEWTFRMVVALLILGFPVALVLAWSFDLTSEGLRRAEAPETGTPGRRMPAVAWMWLVVLIGVAGFAGYSFVDSAPDVEEAGALTGPSTDDYSIAVLPLRNLAGGEENEYFADGMTEDILTNLGLIPDFAVTSRTSVMRYKGSDQTIQQIAGDLGVRYVLEGSLRRDSTRVRIVIQLVEPATDRQIWAQTFDRRMEDVFAVQSEVAQAVVSNLRVQLAGGLEERMGRAPTDDLEAYDRFLRGRDAYYLYTPAGTERAMDLFREAADLDPGFALPRAWFASATAVAVFNFRADAALLEEGEAVARRAIELEPDLGDAYRALGTILGVSGRYDEAIPTLERAIELNPHDFPAIGNLGFLMAIQGEWDRATELVLISIRRDPARSYIDYANLTLYLANLSLFEPAVEAVERARELGAADDPTVVQALAHLEAYRGNSTEAIELSRDLAAPDAPLVALDDASRILGLVGAHDEAREVLERLHALSPEIRPHIYHPPTVRLAHYRAEAGETGSAETLLRDAELRVDAAMEAGDQDPTLHFVRAGIASVRGEQERALDHLEEAVERGWTNPSLTRMDPVLAALHGEPRFIDALSTMESRMDEIRSRVRGLL